MRRDVTEDRRKGAQLQWIVRGDRQVMLGGSIRSKADVAAVWRETR